MDLWDKMDNRENSGTFKPKSHKQNWRINLGTGLEEDMARYKTKGTTKGGQSLEIGRNLNLGVGSN